MQSNKTIENKKRDESSNSIIKNLNVLFIASGYPSKEHPNQSIFTHRSIYQLSKKINVKVIHFTAWLPGRKFIEKRKWDGIDVISLACPQIPGGSDFHINTILLTLFGIIFISKELQKTDLIHSTDLYPSGFVASNWAQKFKKPHTSHVIGSDLNLFLIPKLKKIKLNWLYRIKGFICNSHQLSRKLSESLPGLNNVLVIYRGVDTDLFSSIGRKSGPQLLLPSVRFVYLGGFHTWNSQKIGYFNLKGGHILLDAWKQIENKIQPSNLLISGPGTDIEKLEIWRNKLDFPQSVNFINIIKPEDIPSVIRAADVVIIPSLNEGLPNVANEAQACGRPVLGSDAGGIPESVINGVTGLIIKAGDVDQLSEGIKWFNHNKDKIAEMGNNGRTRMVELFSWDRYSKQMHEFFYSSIQNFHIN